MFDDLTFLKDPEQWPYQENGHAMCCLKGKSFAVAALSYVDHAIDGPNAKLKVQERDGSAIHELTAQEIIEQGWVVD
jgi:hypothetical protein